MINSEAQILRDSLLDRDLPILEDIEDVQNNPTLKSKICEHLSADTLLSKEELSIYEQLQATGRFHEIEQSVSLKAIRPYHEEELQTVILQLNEQTDNIEKQTAILQIQQDAIASLVQNNGLQQVSRQTIATAQSKAWREESDLLDEQLSEKQTTLQAMMTDLSLEDSMIDSIFDEKVRKQLREDDKLLNGLRKLVAELEYEKDSASIRVQELSTRLIKHTVEGIRRKLDNTYLANIEPRDNLNEQVGAEDAKVAALKEELESLYSEILPVAQISVEQQFLEPAAKAREAGEARSRAKAEVAIEYMDKCLSASNQRLQDTLSYAEELCDQKLAAKYLSSTAQIELEKSVASVAHAEGPIKKAPNLQTQRLRDEENSSTKTKTSPIQQMIRNLGLSSGSLNSNDETVSRYLHQKLRESEQKVSHHAATLIETEENMITSSLHEAMTSLGRLRESLLSETRYANVTLVDPDIDEAITLMQTEIERLEMERGMINVDSLKARDTSRENLVQRWSR